LVVWFIVAVRARRPLRLPHLPVWLISLSLFLVALSRSPPCPPPPKTPQKQNPTNNRIAGHETTAATLGFTLAYLSANPDCEKKVLEELDRVLGVDLPVGAAAGGGAAGSGGDSTTTTTTPTTTTAKNQTTIRAIREPTAADIGRLPYLEACFREALRLHPAVAAVTRDACRDTALLGKYSVSRGQRVMVNVVALHRHEQYWEGDGLKPAHEFDPERFMPPHVAKRHPTAFAGFGFGSRACIGSAFALLEAKTFLAVLLPRFVIRAVAKPTRGTPEGAPYPHPPMASLADGGAAATPHDLRLRLSARAGFVAAPPPPAAAEASAAAAPSTPASAGAGGGANLRASGTPIPSSRPTSAGGSAGGAGSDQQPVPFHVLFGSNSGTCEALASRVAEVAAAAGFSPVRLTALDAAHTAIAADGGSASLPSRAAVAVVCSTYNGTPPDNARAFLKWVTVGGTAGGGAGGGGGGEGGEGGGEKQSRLPPGVGYCVVGLGNSQWAATYQKVPRQLDESLSAFGATRVRAFRPIDVNEPDFQDSFESWLATLGSEMRVHFGLEGGVGEDGGGGAAAADGAGPPGAAAASSLAPPPPTLASLSPAPRFTLQVVAGVSASSSSPEALRAALEKQQAASSASAPLPFCADIAAVSRALFEGRRRLAQAGAVTKPVGGGSAPYHVLRVLKNEELQQRTGKSGDERSTRHVELELPSLAAGDRDCGTVPAAGDDPSACDPSAYEAGDHLEVLACNAPALVDAALRALGLTGDEVVVWTPAAGRSARGVDGSAGGGPAAGGGNGGASGPDPLTIATTTRMVVSWVADLGAPPTRRLVEALVGAVQCPPERSSAYDKYCSVEGYKQNVLLPRLTVPELLSSAELRSAPRPPLDALLLALPRVAPRYYSISSSPLASEGKPRRTCSVTVGLVRFNTGSGRVHEGAASSLVHRTMPAGAGGEGQGGGVLIGTVRRLQSTFRLPKDPSAPIIMIGPGTGVAPMMGFLEERDVLLQRGGDKAPPPPLGPAHLFFGCRSDADFIYRDRLERYCKTGALTGLHVAFSRKEGVPKTYVQDLIEQQGAEMWRLLSDAERGGRVYVCGDARRMAPDVRAAFRDLAVRHGGRSQAAADAWIGSMLEGARYLEDVWAGN
jgi:sulfite reductase alpha subunit-like flavoprotein